MSAGFAGRCVVVFFGTQVQIFPWRSKVKIEFNTASNILYCLWSSCTVKNTYSRKCTEDPYPNILTQAPVWCIALQIPVGSRSLRLWRLAMPSCRGSQRPRSSDKGLIYIYIYIYIYICIFIYVFICVYVERERSKTFRYIHAVQI